MTTWVDGGIDLRASSKLLSGIDAYRDFGVRADGTDQATKLQNALNAARDAGPGAMLVLPPGTILTAGTLYFDSEVNIRGAGEGATILKQAPSSNLAVILDSRTRATNDGSATAVGETRFNLSRFIIDGNKQNNTSVATAGLKLYGYRYHLDRMSVRNCKGHGATTEWCDIAHSGLALEPGSVGGDDMQSLITNCRFYFNNRSGLDFNGSNDTIISKCFFTGNAFAPQAGGPNPPTDPNFRNGPKGVGLLLDHCHAFNGGTYCYQFDQGVRATGCIAEGGWYAMLGVHSVGCSWVGGNIFASAAMIYSNKVGVHFGAGAFSFLMRGTQMTELSGGYFDFTTMDGSNADIEAMIFSAADAPLYLGNPSSGIRWNLNGTINSDKVWNFLPPKRHTALWSDAADDHASVSINEDFLNNVTASGSIGRMGWSTFLTGSGAISTRPATYDHPGVLRLTTGATSGSVAALGLSATTDGSFTPDHENEHVFIFNPGNVDANTQIRVGVMTDPAGNPSAAGAYLEKLAGDTNWFYVCRNAGTQTRVDSGIAAATGWQRLRLLWSFGSGNQYGFFLGTTDRVPTTITTNAPVAGTALTPVFQIVNATTAAKTIDADYYGIRVPTLNR